MSKVLQKMKTAVGLAEEQPKGFWESLDEASTLSWTKRFWGFGITAGFGVLFMVLALFLGWIPSKFAVLYTVGSVCFFVSTFFLMGPLNQIKSLTKHYRIVAALVYMGTLGLTLWASFSGKTLLMWLFFLLQLVALGWYILTYIPYGQQAAGSFLSGVFGS